MPITVVCTNQNLCFKMTHKILRDFEIQTDHPIQARKPDVTLIKCHLVDFAVQVNNRVKKKEKKNEDWQITGSYQRAEKKKEKKNEDWQITECYQRAEKKSKGKWRLTNNWILPESWKKSKGKWRLTNNWILPESWNPTPKKQTVESEGDVNTNSCW